MQTPSGFKECVSWNVKYLRWMVNRVQATVGITLVRLGLCVHFRQPVPRALKHRPFGVPGGAALRGKPLCGGHTDGDSGDRLRSGREPRQPHRSPASRTEGFALEGLHTPGCQGRVLKSLGKRVRFKREV